MEDPFAFQSENSAHSAVTYRCSDETKYCTQNDKHFHNGFRGNSIQRTYSPFINLINSPMHHRNQLFGKNSRSLKFATSGSDYVQSVSSQNRVCNLRISRNFLLEVKLPVWLDQQYKFLAGLKSYRPGFAFHILHMLCSSN
jgi:hypothetical protein